MSLFGERFEQDGITGIVERVPQGRSAFDHACWVLAIKRARPELNIKSSEADQDTTLQTILGQIYIFATLATFLRDVQGIGFDWPVTAKDKTLLQAFEFVIDHFDSFQAVLEKINQVQQPNGVVGAPDSKLSEDERKDPLSERHGDAGSTDG